MELQLTFLGQMGLRIQYGGTVIYIDPFLSDHPRRNVKAPLVYDDLKDADYILGTHDHKDHIDRDAWPEYARIAPKAVFVVPEIMLQRGLAGALGIAAERFIGLTDMQSENLGPFWVSAIASAHEFLDCDEQSGLFPYLGYVLEIGAYTVFHAGDSCLYEGYEAKLRSWNFNVMIVPINGRDAVRYSAGYLGNMTFQEAVDLTGGLNPDLVIPGHHDLFAHNGADPKDFMDYLNAKYPEQSAKVLVAGEMLKL